jgi:hypothetical protein
VRIARQFPNPLCDQSILFLRSEADNCKNLQDRLEIFAVKHGFLVSGLWFRVRNPELESLNPEPNGMMVNH